MNFTLRPYQADIFNQIPHALKLGPVLVQAPPRSGKSKIIAALCARIVVAGKIPLVLTHRDKIQKQLIEHCAGVSIAADTDHVFIQPQHTYVAMNQTLVKRPHILSQLLTLGTQLVILCDEAHRGDFNKTFAMLPAALRVAFTATPAWKWAKFLPATYTSLIHGPQISELMQSGNITPIDYYEMRSDLTDLKLASTGEYTEESQFNVFDRAQLYDGLFEELPKFQFKKCIVFCASKKAADKLNEQILQHGYRSVCYYSGLPTYNLAQFTTLHTVDVLVTVSALSEGFDYSGIDLNILWRATTSLPLFIQMGMRGATPEIGKIRTTVLDFGGNNSRFGGHTGCIALTMDRDWNVLWQPPEKLPKKRDGVASIKHCTACDYIISALARSCSNCGYIYPDVEQRLIDGQLVQIQEVEAATTAVLHEATGRRISTLTAKELAVYAKQKDKKAFAMRVAKARTITQPTYAYEYAKEIGYKSQWADRIVQDIAEIQMYEPDYKIDYADIIIR